MGILNKPNSRQHSIYASAILNIAPFDCNFLYAGDVREGIMRSSIVCHEGNKCIRFVSRLYNRWW
jgi:hypothetical protein